MHSRPATQEYVHVWTRVREVERVQTIAFGCVWPGKNTERGNRHNLLRQCNTPNTAAISHLWSAVAPPRATWVVECGTCAGSLRDSNAVPLTRGVHGARMADQRHPEALTREEHRRKSPKATTWPVCEGQWGRA